MKTFTLLNTPSATRTQGTARRWALLGTLALALTQAQAGPWTSVGSAGTVDDDAFVFAAPSPGVRAVLNGPALSLASGISPLSVRVRYNVVDVFDRKGLAGPIRLAANFVDNGADAQVVLYLFEQNMTTTATRTLLSLNSNAYLPGPGPQVQSVSAGCTFMLDFTRNAYWIEAVMTRTGAAGAPVLNQLRITDEVLC